MQLTPRQQEILALLRTHAEQAQPAPTIAQLCRLLGLRSRGSLHKHIQALVKAGCIEPLRGRQRGIRVLPPAPPEDHLPLLGRIAAGRPIEAVEQPELIQIPAHLRGSGTCYVLEVIGDSMREAGILDGDHIVVERRERAADGAIVVALIRGSEVTLKRLFRRPGEVILRSENSEMPPLTFMPGEVEIQGVVVGQMRSYRRSKPRPE